MRAVLQPDLIQGRQTQIRLMHQRGRPQAGMALVVQLSDGNGVDVGIEAGEQLIQSAAVSARPALEQGVQYQIVRRGVVHSKPG